MEDHLRLTDSKVASRRAIYGKHSCAIVKKIAERDLASYQLVGVNHLLPQGLDSFLGLSPRKLWAVQLTLGIVERKLPKTLTIVKKRRDTKLAELVAELPNGPSTLFYFVDLVLSSPFLLLSAGV